MADVQVDHRLAADAEPHLEDDLEDRTGGNVARHEVPVDRVPVLEEVPGPAVARHPDAAALAADRLRDQPELVGARNRGGMHLDELAVRVVRALLVHGARGAARVDDGVRALAEDHARAPRRQHDGGRGEGVDLHAGEIERGDAAAVARLVDDGGAELPLLELPHETGRLVAAHLLVERVDQLLPRRRAGEGGAMEQRAAEAAEVEQPFGRPVERDAHAVEEEDDRRPRLAHRLHRRLVRQEVAAVDRVVEVPPRRVALALPVDGGVDPALCTDGVRALDRHEREQVDGEPRLGDADRGHEAREPAADDDEARP